jgi:hypothetical protein
MRNARKVFVIAESQFLLRPTVNGLLLCWYLIIVSLATEAD